MATGRWIVAGLLAGALHAQHAAPSPAQPPPRQPPTTQPTLAQPAPARPAPATHGPQPTLAPLLAWQHVKDGNAAVGKARTAGTPVPPLPARPAGAGRYVCAVLVCADADIDVPAALGLHRADVLLISAPGPFATADTIALLERTVADERVPLVLVLGHADCRTLAPRDGKAPADALSRRVDTLREQAARRGVPGDGSLAPLLVQIQREQLLAASDPLRERVLRDDLRVLPGTIDGRSLAITWHHQRADAMPLAPVK